MANEKIINKILGEFANYNPMDWQLDVMTPNGKTAMAVLPVNPKELFDYVMFGLQWAVQNIPQSKAKMFYASNKGRFFDLVMRAMVDALTTYAMQNYNKIAVLYWQFAAGLEIVFGYLDGNAPLDSKNLNKLPYEHDFCSKLTTDYPDIHPIQFYMWCSNKGLR